MAKTKKRAKRIKAEVPETFKVEPKIEKEVKAKPVVEEKVEPKMPLVPIEQGLKRPSITDLRAAHTKKSYLELIEAYKIQNPTKYEAKKSELERKLKEAK